MTLGEFKKLWEDDRKFILARTSGSTGKPKEIQLLKSKMIESAIRTNRFFGITAQSRLHSCIDFEFIGGKMMGVRAFVAGARITAETPSNQPLKGLSHDERIDMLSVVPSQLEYLLSSHSDRERGASLPQIGTILVGGSPLSEDTVRKVEESGLNVWESYGMTETCSHIALRKVGRDTSFSTLPGITVRQDYRNCLTIRIGSDEFRTNDIADIDTHGRFRILGRIDNVIISGAKKIHPEKLEIELARELNSLGYDFTSIAVSSRPDSKWGEAAVLVVEISCLRSKEDNIKNFGAILIRRLKEETTLPHYLIPKDIRIMSIPRTINGKIDRSKLKDLLSETGNLS